MKYQRYKLKELANINSGYSFRTKIQNNPEGNTYAIQMRDVSNDRSGFIGEPYKVDVEKINKVHFLQSGDILFMSKGANNFGICYDVSFKPAVAASAFFVIRIKNQNLTSSYLCWYLNSSKVQVIIEGNRAGTYIPNVNKSVLEELEIIIPPIRIQELIAGIYRLSNEEALLIEKIKERKALLMNSILSDIIFKQNG